MNAAGFGAIAQVGGTLVNGMAGSASAASQQDALAYNETMARYNAQQARDAALQDELSTRRQASQIKGQQRAAIAESGVDPNAGSALEVQIDSARNAELAALQQRYQGTLRGYALDSQASQFAWEREAVGGSRQSGLLGTGLSMASQLLSSAGNGSFGGMGGGGGLGGILGGGSSAAGSAGAAGVTASSAFTSAGAATSGVGAGGSLGAFAGGASSAAAGASGAAGGASGLSSLGSLGPWGALAAVIVGNESYAKSNGYRREGTDYYKDLATGRVLSQDVDNRWSPMLFGKSDRFGLGKDMSFAADLGSFQFGKAWKDLRQGSLGKLFKLF